MNQTNEPNRSAMAEASDIGSLLVPSGCSGFRYLVNDGAPEEGTDIHHEGPCSIHRGDIRGDGASDELGDIRSAGADALGDAFTVDHCTTWCVSVGIDLAYVPAMVRELVEAGPEPTLAWPTVARCVGARYDDGMAY